MTKWNEFLTVVGLTVHPEGNEYSIISNPTKRHLDLIEKALILVNAKFEKANNKLIIGAQDVSYSKWLQAMNLSFSERYSWYRFPNGENAFWVDPYMLGLIHQLNRLGYKTNYSCSGHGRSKPMIAFDDIGIDEIKDLFNYIGVCYTAVIKNEKFLEIHFRTEDEVLLPMFSLRLSRINDYADDSFEKRVLENIDRKTMLLNLLGISGISKNEVFIRNYLYDYLRSKVDDIWIDEKGNLLGYQFYGCEGPTILLSAHLDVYQEIKMSKSLIINDQIVRREGSILGADDRAGVGMIVSILKDLKETRFKGCIKFSFTVEEEIGCLGSKNVDESFLNDVNFAVVMDRRGKSDIVTHNDIQRFCSYSFEMILTNFLSQMKRFNNYRTTKGGISDVAVWANRSIESINISVGFYNEHTSDEYLNLNDWDRSRKFCLELIEKFYPMLIEEKFTTLGTSTTNLKRQEIQLSYLQSKI